MSESNSGEEWVSEEDLMALRMNRQYLVGLGDSGPTQAMAILKEASPAAAMQVVKLALHGESETVRLRAATYILDHTMGDGGGAGDPWDELRGEVIRDVEDYLKTAGKAGPPTE